MIDPLKATIIGALAGWILALIVTAVERSAEKLELWFVKKIGE